jgi:tartrate-resistant acid phosphatase type 5
MPEFHAEPYLYLPSVTHESALVAWGAFYFRVTSKGIWKLVDDTDLKYVHPPRKDSIGARSAPYGPAHVEVYDPTGALVSVAKTEATNHCWVTGLAPDTEYTYKVFVKADEWAQGGRWDWSARDRALVQAGARYDNRFRTHPHPKTAATSLSFAVIGDFGVGMKDDRPDRRQQQVADALRLAVDTEGVRLVLTTGDNIYAGRKLLGIPIGATGDEDDDWFFTYFQPYRYIINRVPVYPSIGNHDAAESEDCDDRAEVEDNFYICERIAGEEASGRASHGPGLFYRFRYGSEIEFLCIDTSKEGFFKGHRLFEFPKHWTFLDASLPEAPRGTMWRIPFAHHPPYSAGPQHHNTKEMARLFPLFDRAGVAVMFSGHEHNFQHSRVNGIDYFVTGAAGKFRSASPDRFEEAHTESWSNLCHFLLVRIEGDRMLVRAIGERTDTAAGLIDIARWTPGGATLSSPINVRRP